MIFTTKPVNARQGPGLSHARVAVVSRWSLLQIDHDEAVYNVIDGLRWWRAVARGWIAEETSNNEVLCYRIDSQGFTDFRKAFCFVLGQEGALNDDPNDAGGLTKYGIAQRFNPDINVRELNIAGAEAVYKRKYWDSINANLQADSSMAAWPLNLYRFDAHVNMGLGGLQAVDSAEASQFLINRSNYYRNLRQFNLYGQGWLNRVSDIEEFSRVFDSPVG